MPDTVEPVEASGEDALGVVTSPLMMSCIATSSASTRFDICITAGRLNLNLWVHSQVIVQTHCDQGSETTCHRIGYLVVRAAFQPVLAEVSPSLLDLEAVRAGKRTKAVSSWGLDISPGLVAMGCFVGVLEPDVDD